ncbi:MAG: tail tape measure protein [Blastomonas sp.]
MDEEIERLVVRVQADTQGFARDVATMRSELAGPLAGGIEIAGNALERGLLGALRRGKLGFEDLRRVALAVINDIASAAIRAGLESIGAGGGGNGGLLAAGVSILTAALGAPGRATGGPVAPGRAFMVGERGPEIFVPTSSGRIEALTGAAMPRDVRVAITINAPGGTSQPEALQRSSRQVAHAVRRALAQD